MICGVRSQLNCQACQELRRYRHGPSHTPPMAKFTNEGGGVNFIKGASICDVHRILGFFLGTLFCLFKYLLHFLTPTPSLRTSYMEGSPSRGRKKEQ